MYIGLLRYCQMQPRHRIDSTRLKTRCCDSAQHARLEERIVVVAGRHDLWQDVVAVLLRLRAGSKQLDKRELETASV